jgi:predicted HTH domain antitoxin
VQVTLDIPDELLQPMLATGKDAARVMLEALAVEGYRSERLSEAEVQRLLGLATRMEVHALLKEHGAYLHYSLADAERDRESARQLRARGGENSAERRTG